MRRAIFANAFSQEVDTLGGRTTETCIKEGLRQARLLQAIDLNKFTIDEMAELAELVCPGIPMPKQES